MKFVILILALVGAVLANTVPTRGDYRNEFDRLLLETAIESTAKGQEELLKLTQEITALEMSKSKVDQTRIIGQLKVIMAFVQGSERLLQEELKRIDLNILERFNFESGLATLQVLIKNLQETEAKVKAVKTA